MSNDTMFDHLKSSDAQTAETLNEFEKKETSPASPSETKPAQNVREDAKTPDKETFTPDFHKHPRFQEMVQEKNSWKSRAEELAPLKSEVDQLKTQLAELTGQRKSELPKFETVEELTAYIAQLPERIKQELRAEQQAVTAQEQALNEEASRQVQEQLNQLREQGVELNTREERDELLNFAIKYQLDNLITAHELFSQVQEASDAGKKKGEEIGRRKADSGLKSNSKVPDTNIVFRGRTLDDVFEEAKRNLPT